MRIIGIFVRVVAVGTLCLGLLVCIVVGESWLDSFRSGTEWPSVVGTIGVLVLLVAAAAAAFGRLGQPRQLPEEGRVERMRRAQMWALWAVRVNALTESVVAVGERSFGWVAVASILVWIALEIVTRRQRGKPAA